jgi:hypothetical protein
VRDLLRRRLHFFLLLPVSLFSCPACSRQRCIMERSEIGQPYTHLLVLNTSKIARARTFSLIQIYLDE